MTALLLNHLWQSSLCVGGAGLMALVLRRNSAKVRFWVWFAASLKFLVPFSALTALGAYALTPMVSSVTVPTVTHIEPFAKPFTASAVIQITASLTKPSSRLERTPLPNRAEVPARPVIPTRTAQSVPPAYSAKPLLTANSAPARSAVPAFPSLRLDLESALLTLWAAGFLVLVIRWIIQWLRLRALLRDAVEAQVDAPVAVKFSASRLEPGLVGILHPVILLPTGIEQELSPAEMQAILAHELCHWRRRDSLLSAIHMLVEALFWFFPLVWWLGARLNAERERACDESVLADGNNPQIYAEGILKVCRVYLQSPMACVAGVSGGGLKKRIKSITENRLILQLNTARRFLLATSAATALILPMALGLIAVPVGQIQAKAAQLPSSTEIAQKSAKQALPLAPQASAAALKINRTSEPPTPVQALQSNEVATGGGEESLSPRLFRLLPKETLSVPPPDSSRLLPVLPNLVASNEPPITPAQPAPSPSLVAAVAHSGQPSASNPAQAEAPTAINCAAPKLLNSLPMERVPGSDTMTVTATIDGHPERLLVGIGDPPTQLWFTQAGDLHLPFNQGGGWGPNPTRPINTVSHPTRFIRAKRFRLGSLATKEVDIGIGRDPDSGNLGSDGVLGPDMMERYDIDLDFAHRRLNYFSPEECKGAGIYWAPNKITSVQAIVHGLQVYVPVTLEGHEMMALLDTGADRTFLNPLVAKKLFGIEGDSLPAGTVRVANAATDAGLHVFSRLTFGGVIVNNPKIAIPVLPVSTYFSKKLPSLLIGMDVLKHTHLYISYQNQRVYFSAAGDGQALKATEVASSQFNIWSISYERGMFYYLHSSQQSAQDHGFLTHWSMVTHHGTALSSFPNTGFGTAGGSFNNRIVAGPLSLN